MRSLTINGIDIQVISASEAGGQIENSWLPLRLGRDEYIYIWPWLTVKDLITITGHDYSKIDTAVPQDWLNARGFKARDWVWSYEGNSLFGKPLSVASMKNDLVTLILDALMEDQ